MKLRKTSPRGEKLVDRMLLLLLLGGVSRWAEVEWDLQLHVDPTDGWAYRSRVGT